MNISQRPVALSNVKAVQLKNKNNWTDWVKQPKSLVTLAILTFNIYMKLNLDQNIFIILK